MVIRRFLGNLFAAGGSSRVTRGGIALLAMLVVGSTGYVVIEGWSVFDAAYMTVVTMTTVGYGEVRPLSPAGRAFNLFVMIGGVGLMLYILTVTVQAVVEDEVLEGLFRRRRMKAKLEALEQHYILCGYGRVGREVAAVFRGEEAPFVVIDTNEAAVAAAEADGILAICGNATHNEMLRQAGVERARGLIAASGSDSDNVVITLTASAINPKLNIVARADDAETTEKLTMAGADRVVTPYRIGGRRMGPLRHQAHGRRLLRRYRQPVSSGPQDLGNRSPGLAPCWHDRWRLRGGERCTGPGPLQARWDHHVHPRRRDCDGAGRRRDRPGYGRRRRLDRGQGVRLSAACIAWNRPRTGQGAKPGQAERPTGRTRPDITLVTPVRASTATGMRRLRADDE